MNLLLQRVKFFLDFERNASHHLTSFREVFPERLQFPLLKPLREKLADNLAPFTGWDPGFEFLQHIGGQSEGAFDMGHGFSLSAIHYTMGPRTKPRFVF